MTLLNKLEDAIRSAIDKNGLHFPMTSMQQIASAGKEFEVDVGPASIKKEELDTLLTPADLPIASKVDLATKLARRKMTAAVKDYSKNVLLAELIGISPISRWEGCPDNVHPSRVCVDPQAIISVGISMSPQSAENSHEPLRMLGSVMQIHAMNADLIQMGYKLSRYLRKVWGYQAGFSYLPIHLPKAFAEAVKKDPHAGLVPAQYISGKMAALLGGLGKRGVNDLLITPEYGPLVRLVTVVTQAPLVGDPPSEMKLLCESCLKNLGGECIKACPTGAIKAKTGDPNTLGDIDWTKCFSNKLADEILMLGYAACVQCAVKCLHSKKYASNLASQTATRF